ncbi:MAG: reverse transcriptase domain-containing protein [Chitinophagales bacterium]
MLKEKFKFRKRGYRHLTNKLGLLSENEITKLLKKLATPEFIAQYAFLPLIHIKIEQRRYKKDKNGNRSHKKWNKRKQKYESTAKVRPIHYATHIDTQLYAYYAYILKEKYENILKKNKILSDSIIAYRYMPIEQENKKPHKKPPGKSTIHFAKEVFKEITNRGECIAITLDIENFFSSLSHQYLKKAWIELLDDRKYVNMLSPDHYNVYNATTKFRYIRLDDLRKSHHKKKGFDEKYIAELKNEGIDAFFRDGKDFKEKIVQNPNIRTYKNQFKDVKGNSIGIPQGLPISAVLANIYLLDFDRQVYNELIEKHGVYYRRYSDDILILCSEKKLKFINKFLQEKIRKCKLKISKDKTEIIRFKYNRHNILMSERVGFKEKRLEPELNKNGFPKKIPLKYLGFEFYGNKTLIKSAGLGKFYRKMKKTIKVKSKRLLYEAQKVPNKKVIFWKRKIYRRFSFAGHYKKRRKFEEKIIKKVWDEKENTYILKEDKKTRTLRGNYLSYAYKASCIMKEPAIRKQVRNHWKILQEEIKKHIDEKHL